MMVKPISFKDTVAVAPQIIIHKFFKHSVGYGEHIFKCASGKLKSIVTLLHKNKNSKEEYLNPS